MLVKIYLYANKHKYLAVLKAENNKKSIKKILTAESTRLLVCFSARNTGEQGSALHSFSKITSMLFVLLILVNSLRQWWSVEIVKR